MSKEGEIVCKATKWFIWRALLMLIMFSIFGLYFLYDWKYGYPKKNVIVAHYSAFDEAEKAWLDEEKRNRWADFVGEQTLPFEDDQAISPPDTDFTQKWPSILADKTQMEEKKPAGLWKDYSGERVWPQKVNIKEDRKPAGKLTEQLVSAGICGILSAIALFFLFRTKGREMRVDDEAFYPPGGPKVPFDKIRVLDKRKWETKGLATVTYEDESGQSKKAKIDGMGYGQFKEEDGAPAEALFKRVLSNFSGELIEHVPDDEEEDDEEEKKSEIN